MKEKMRKILVKLGRKCRPLAYPVFFVMVFFVSVYHTCRRVFLNMGRQKFYRMVCGSAAAAALVLALFVWPTMAEEQSGEPVIEVVEETEKPESTAAPEMTVEPEANEEPEATEAPETDEGPEVTEAPTAPAETQEPESSGEPAQTEESEMTVEPEQVQEPEPEEVMSPAQTGEPDGTQRPAASAKPYSRIGKAGGLKKAGEPVTVKPPVIGAQPYLSSSKYTYGQLPPQGLTISVTANASGDGERLSYQWYVKKGSSDEAVSGATDRQYTISSDTDAGEYTYYCKVTSTSEKDPAISATASSEEVSLEIEKAEPALTDFTYKNPGTLYYTAKAQTVSVAVKDGVRGMGEAEFQYYRAGGEGPVELKEDGDYTLKLHVNEGQNYKDATFDTEDTIKMTRITLSSGVTAYRISEAVQGDAHEGKTGYWYKSDVKLVPSMTGYRIAENDDNPDAFADALVIETEGENVQPSEIYLQDKNGRITKAIPVYQSIHIDKTPPTGKITAAPDAKGHDSAGFAYYNSGVTVTIGDVEDRISGVKEVSYYYSNSEMKEDQISGWKSNKGGDTHSFSLSKDGRYYIYGKVRDKAGNTGYPDSIRVVIDREDPKISCDGGEPAKSYTADKKSFEASDANIKEVRVYKGTDTQTDGNPASYKPDSDGSRVLFDVQLEGESVTYTIVAEDYAGNTKQYTVTLNNPRSEVNADDLDFGIGETAAVYGYDTVEPKEIVLTKVNAKEEPQIYDIAMEKGSEDFEVVAHDQGKGFTVRPKDGLHVGTHVGVVRIRYNQDVHSATTCKCTFEVKKATLTAKYTGHTAYYHTIPDFAPHIQVTGFVNGDTAQTAKEYIPPVISYQEGDGTQKRALETTANLMPDKGSAADYDFEYQSGTMAVERRELPECYQILGTEGEDGWYISGVEIAPGEGYEISSTEAEGSFSGTALSVDKETKGEDSYFYLMNTKTGEISAKMTRNIRIDKTGPVFAEDEGIRISRSLWNSFANAVTFGMYFNDVMSVSIKGSDDISGVKDIRYYMSANSLSEAGVKALPENTWSSYGSSFSLSPTEVENVVIYARITNGAGIRTYISSDGIVFDDRAPEVAAVTDGKEYFAEHKEILITDKNLKDVTLYEGKEISGAGNTHIPPVGSTELKLTVDSPASGSKDYTILAADNAGNMTEKTFRLTHPIYDIKPDKLEIQSAVYGYSTGPAVSVTWKETETANAPAVIADVAVRDTQHFSVKESDGTFFIVPRQGLAAGDYQTDVTILYGDKQEAQTTCRFTVEKAILTAKYAGQDAYYHTRPDYAEAITVTGFVGGESAATAAGYEAPVISLEEPVKETAVLTPSGGKADNYTFSYNSGVLVVRRRAAERGRDGQYDIRGVLSDTGWYTSDISIEPAAGFALALDEEGKDTAEKITLTKDTDNGEQKFCLMNEKTGEIYEEICFEYKKDSVAPVFRGVADGESYEANSLQVTAEDACLSSVIVNGMAQEISGGRSVFTLSADQTSTVYVLTATDRAGNVRTVTVVMKQPSTVSDSTDNADSQDGKDTQGTVKKKVQVAEDAPSTVLTTSTDNLVDSVLTAGEKKAVNNGSDADIGLRVRGIDGSVSQADKELIIASLGDYVVGEYLDITLWKTVGSSGEKAVHNTSKPISVTITVPEKLRNTVPSRKRTFAVFRIHNGAVSVLEDRDSVENTVTISTDKFSTYALVYRDMKNGDSTFTSGGTGSSTGSSGGYGSGDGASPEMGDDTPLFPMTAAFILSWIGIIVTLFARKRWI